MLSYNFQLIVLDPPDKEPSSMHTINETHLQTSVRASSKINILCVEANKIYFAIYLINSKLFTIFYKILQYFTIFYKILQLFTIFCKML